MLVVARLLEFIGCLGNDILDVLSYEVGLEGQLGLPTLEGVGVFLLPVFEFLGFGHYVLLLGHHVLDVLDGLVDGFLAATLGG